MLAMPISGEELNSEVLIASISIIGMAAFTIMHPLKRYRLLKLGVWVIFSALVLARYVYHL